jgi:hypothetical protein
MANPVKKHTLTVCNFLLFILVADCPNFINLGSNEESLPRGPKSALKSRGSQSNASVGSFTERDLGIRHMQNVGWMIKLSERRFLMLFSDGIRVSIDAKEQILDYEDTNSQEHLRQVSLQHYKYNLS